MADNTTNAIRAARRAMEQVIGPAVASADGIVREQAQLVAATLGQLEEQLPFTREHLAYELRCNAELAEDLLGSAPGPLQGPLGAAAATARHLASDLGPSSADLQDANAQLTALASAVVRAAEDGPRDVRLELIRRVVTQAGSVIAGQRAWFAGQGWGGTGDVGSMSELFGPEQGGTIG